MPTLTEIPIRFAFDVQSRTAAPPIGSATDVIIYRGNPFVIQAAAFNGTPGGSTFVDVSNVTLANLIIRANDSQGTVLIEKVLNDTDVDTALTYSNWVAGNGQQFAFSLSDTDTNQDVPSDGNLDIYGVLSIVTDSGEITLGFFQGVIQEDGIGNPTSPTTPDYTTYSREEINVLIAGHLTGILNFSDISGTLALDQLPSGTVVSIDSIGEDAFYFFNDSTFTPQLLSKDDALTFLLPDQTSHANEFLQTDGSGTLSWAAAAGSGGVSSDAIWDAKGDLAGGTGADTAAKLTVGANDTMLMADSAQTTGLKWGSPSTVRTALGLVIGTNVQAFDADLSTLAGLTATTDNFIVSVSSAWASRTPAQVKTTLAIANTDVSGLGTLSTQNGTFSGTSSGTNTGDQTVPANTTATSNQFFTAYNSTTGAFTKAQPTFANLASTPTTLSGYGITDAQPLDSDLTAIAGLTATTDNFIVSVSSAWASRTPTQVKTTLGLVIGTNVQAWDADLDAVAALATDSFGLALLTKTSAANIRSYIGAGTSSFSGAFSSLTGIPTTLSGYGITDAQPLDSDLTTIAGLTATTDNFIVSVSSAWASRTPSQVRTTLGLVIGTNVQAWDADLDTLAGLTATTDNFIVSVSSAWASRTPAQVKTTLGLVIGTNVQAWDTDLDSWAAITRASGFDTFATTPSSANLRSLLTDELGTGAVLCDGATLTALLTTATCGSSLASLNIPAGTVPTTPNDGDIFADANCMYGCTDTGNPGVLPIFHFIRADSTVTYANDTNPHPVFTTPTNGRLTLETGTYMFQAVMSFTSMSATSGNLKLDILGAGTATTGTWNWASWGVDGGLGAAAGGGQSNGNASSASPASVTIASTNTNLWFSSWGSFEVTGAGTLIPTITQVTASAAVLSIGSYFMCYRVGSTSMTSVGQWD